MSDVFEFPDNSRHIEKARPVLVMNDYAPGEVRLYAKDDRVFADQRELDAYMKSAAVKIKTILNKWAEERYGRPMFRVYDDGSGIRVQTGLHDLTSEDKSKIAKATEQV